MPDEKETEMQIPNMSQIKDVDDMIRVLFGVPPEGKKLLSTKMKRRVINHVSTRTSNYRMSKL